MINACDAFFAAIAQNRQAPDPYFGMGYLLFLLQDYPAAIRYLGEAQHLDPEHHDAQMLIAEIKALLRPAAEVPDVNKVLSQSFARPESDLEQFDYDQLYDDVEQRIYELVQQLNSTSLPPPVPSADKQAVFQLSTIFEKLNQRLKKIGQQLNIVEEEIDADELRIKLKLAESLTQRYAQALNTSEQMRALKQTLKEMNLEQNQLRSQIEQAQNREAIAGIEKSVESLLDRCDNVADRLDEMENARHPVSPLLDLYEDLISDIEKLNEYLDDALENF